MLHLLYTCFLVALGLRVLKILYRRLAGGQTKDVKSLGKWAVVTGATDGIGKAFAEEFASRGLSVVLVSRSQIKLEAVSEEISGKYGVQIKTIAADFTSLDKTMYKNIGHELDGLEVGVLVNNVGISYAHPEYFLDLQRNHENLYNDIINCNIASTVNMTRFVLPGMVSRGRGWIINLSSGLADIPAPLLTLYAASKAFISKFSQDLSVEYARKGIEVQWLKPGLVATTMSKIQKTSWMVPSPRAYVKSALHDLSMKPCSEGYFAHVLSQNAIMLAASLFPNFVANKLLAVMLNTRKKALKKCKSCTSD